ncbi:MAG: transporter [Candidatus Saccharibacteria bacterium]|nr:transporter [Candidatus Saccharibacteria bacterium]
MEKIKARIANQKARHTPADPDAQRSHREIMVIIFALMAAMLLAALDQTIVSTALPKIASDLHGLNKLSWVATAYLLTSAIVTPIYGKVSDSLGRKKVFQFAIIVFLIGSALCGAAQNMDQLVIFRAIQGLGGGGLISLALATIGDIVPPRQRGRYQGYFGAVFGVSSILGPLLGGLFTDHLSWRWIFYINIPIGIVAFAAIALRLHLPVRSERHRFDVWGSLLMAGAVSCLLLALTWGGNTYAWGSGTILGLFAGAIVLGAALIARERKAAEPIFPPRLFKNDIFIVSSLLSGLVGLVMLGSIIFLPLYQQIVRHDSPTISGLLLLPFVAGLFSGSLTSGRLISKYGRYRHFPLIGNALLVLGLFLFSHIQTDTSQVVLSIWMIIMGLGIGLQMQVMTLAVQNSSDRKDLGTATSIVTFFRSLGSSIGTAVFGLILTSQLTHYLTQAFAGSASQVSSAGLQSSSAAIQSLPPQVAQTVLQSYTNAFQDVFLAAIPFAVAAFIVALFLRELPLHDTIKKEAGSGGAEI